MGKYKMKDRKFYQTYERLLGKQKVTYIACLVAQGFEETYKENKKN